MKKNDPKDLDKVGNLLEKAAKKIADEKDDWTKVYPLLLKIYTIGWDNCIKHTNKL